MSEHIAFMVDSAGVAVDLTISEAQSKAFDILYADGADVEKWLPSLIQMEKEGKDPVALANKIVLLRHALKEPK